MGRLISRGRIALILAGLLLVPMAGAASGAGATAAAGKAAATQCVSPLQALSLVSANPRIPIQTCLVDQYGDVYQFTIDGVHKYLYGTVTTGCAASTWPVTGSYVKKGGFQMELSAANPLGTSDTGCVLDFKLKGRYPDAAWYYDYGYGAQEFTYAPCIDAPGKPHRVAHAGPWR